MKELANTDYREALRAKGIEVTDDPRPYDVIAHQFGIVLVPQLVETTLTEPQPPGLEV